MMMHKLTGKQQDVKIALSSAHVKAEYKKASTKAKQPSSELFARTFFQMPSLNNNTATTSSDINVHLNISSVKI